MFTLFVASRKRYEKTAFGVVSQFEKNGKIVKSKTVKIAGFDKDNGTSRTDLLGVIEAVRTVPINYKGEVKIKVSDPWLVKVMGIKDGESMFSTWVKNGFKKADGKPLINSWLYEILHVELEARKKHGITFSIGKVDSTNNPAGQVAYELVSA